MNITLEKVNALNAVVKIKLSPEDYQSKVEAAIKSHSKKANMPGFRKGMVPASHIKKLYGKSILVEEINNLLSDSLNNYINEEKLEVLGQPLPKEDDSYQPKWDYNESFEFSFELGMAPEIKDTFSAKDKVTHYKVRIDEETLASRLKNIRRSYGKMSNPDVVTEEDVIYGELTQLSPDGTVFEGGIVNTASIAGRQGYPAFAPYCASKFAVNALTQATARGLAEHNITCNSFAPGVVDTPLWIDLDRDLMEMGMSERPGQATEEFSAGILRGRAAKPADLEGMALFLASSDSDYMTGQTIMIDGGMVLI